MRPITRRLRLLAAVLGFTQGAVPALAVAHELTVGSYGGSAAHAEALGASHESTAHPHDCGICRNVVSKAGMPPRGTFAEDRAASHTRPLHDRAAAAPGNDGPPALPRAPPVG